MFAKDFWLGWMKNSDVGKGLEKSRSFYYDGCGKGQDL